jgi:hypothetical protein
VSLHFQSRLRLSHNPSRFNTEVTEGTERNPRRKGPCLFLTFFGVLRVLSETSANSVLEEKRVSEARSQEPEERGFKAKLLISISLSSLEPKKAEILTVFEGIKAKA